MHPGLPTVPMVSILGRDVPTTLPLQQSLQQHQHRQQHRWRRRRHTPGREKLAPKGNNNNNNNNNTNNKNNNKKNDNLKYEPATVFVATAALVLPTKTTSIGASDKARKSPLLQQQQQWQQQRRRSKRRRYRQKMIHWSMIPLQKQSLIWLKIIHKH